jgi:hypothetical protein
VTRTAALQAAVEHFDSGAFGRDSARRIRSGSSSTARATCRWRTRQLHLPGRHRHRRCA